MATAVLYLAAALAGGLAATLVRLPPLVGFLAAGFALGAAGAPELPGIELVASWASLSCCSRSGSSSTSGRCCVPRSG